MSTRMNLELVKFINSDLTWNAVKKGHRSATRRPRRTEASSSELCFDFGNKMQESAAFDYEKSGVAILGQHFAEEVVDVPIKKRILKLQSPSLEGAWSAQPQIHEASDLLAGGKHASGAIKLTEKELPYLNDFSGIELLAAAACHSSFYDSPGHVESSAVEEHTTPIAASYPDGIQQEISPMESDDSSVQDGAFPVKQMCDNENDDEDKRHVSSKGVRLHWDLNTVMEEWDEPCDILVDPHSEKSYPKDAYSDAFQNAKANLEGDETTKSQATGDERGNMLPEGKHDVGIQGNSDGDCLGKTHDAESCVSKSDVVDSFTQPAKWEHVSTSTASVSIGETTAKVESDDRQAVSEVVQGGCLSLKGDNADDKLASEDHLSDCCGSNVSQDERGHMAEGNTTDKVISGYDSPVEDGELREPTWQKDELEERECVDYESDKMYEDNFDTIESLSNEIPLDHHQTIEASDALPKNLIEEEGDKADALGSKTSEYQQQEHSRTVVILQHKDDCSKKFPHEKNALDEFPRRNLFCTDRSTSMSFGTSRNSACIRRSRSHNIGDTYSRSERDFGQEKHMAREGPSYNASGQWDESFSKNSHGYSRPKTIMSGGSSNLDRNQAISYNARGVSRTFSTRPSPSDRNEYYGIHRGTPPTSGISQDRCRSGLRRVPQEEYIGPEPCYSERKIPCFSSNYVRGSHVSRSRRRSRSRSRSGSPIAWHFQKKRNVDTKRQSPDHSSDTRFHFRKPSEIEAGGPFSPTRARPFSPTRARVSSERVSRSFDDRNIIHAPYRGRRSSPVRTFHRERFDPPRYLENPKLNDNFRPAPRSARFQPTREKFEANGNYSSIHDDKYGTLNERRRFRYDMDEPFKGCNFRNKDTGFRYTREEDRCFRDPVGKALPENTK